MENKTLKPHHIKQYPFGIADGVMVQTCTREPKGEGLPIGYKVGRVTGYSELTGVEVMFGEDEFPVDYELGEVKLVLRRLTSMTKEEKVLFNNDLSKTPYANILPQIRTNNNCDWYASVRNLKIYEWLFDRCFDLDGLIDAGLALDINNLK